MAYFSAAATLRHVANLLPQPKVTSLYQKYPVH